MNREDMKALVDRFEDEVGWKAQDGKSYCGIGHITVSERDAIVAALRASAAPEEGMTLSQFAAGHFVKKGPRWHHLLPGENSIEPTTPLYRRPVAPALSPDSRKAEPVAVDAIHAAIAEALGYEGLTWSGVRKAAKAVAALSPSPSAGTHDKT